MIDVGGWWYGDSSSLLGPYSGDIEDRCVIVASRTYKCRYVDWDHFISYKADIVDRRYEIE